MNYPTPIRFITELHYPKALLESKASHPRHTGSSPWVELLALELQDLTEADFELSLTGFDPKEIDDLLLDDDADEKANEIPPVPDNPTSRPGDLWLCGPHRVLCADCTSPDAVARLLGDRQPALMVTDPPYGISLDSEWRDRAGLNTAPGQKRTPL